MSEFERMSPEAYERKKEYNRRYSKQYAKDHGLINLGVPVTKELRKEIMEYLDSHGMQFKDFVLNSYNELRIKNGDKPSDKI